MNKLLKNKRCKPCEDKTGRISSEEIEKLSLELDHWIIEDDKKIEKTYPFKDFKEAMIFVNKVAEISEDEGHHPDILIFSWNKVKISLSTHSIGGLSENDFILAAKIDGIKI